jgi:hypothetical protein
MLLIGNREIGGGGVILTLVKLVKLKEMTYPNAWWEYFGVRIMNLQSSHALSRLHVYHHMSPTYLHTSISTRISHVSSRVSSSQIFPRVFPHSLFLHTSSSFPVLLPRMIITTVAVSCWHLSSTCRPPVRS